MIKNWNDISNEREFENVLLGNGFSMTFWERFGYRSLLENCGNDRVGRYVCTKDIFKKLKTQNFEEVLRAIYHTWILLRCCGDKYEYNQKAIKTLYLDIRDVLISSINSIHPKLSDLPINEIGNDLIKYKSIFTTNYDLLPYWATLSGQSNVLVDYFWGENGAFDLQKVNVFNGKIPIHYLHGALHLRSCNVWDAKKISIKNESGAEGIIDLDFDKFELPLFISEGQSVMKMNRIRGNVYLNFCYEKLCQSKGGLVIYGHDLGPEYDEHIVEAIRKSQNQHIAIGVFSGLSGAKKRAFAARVDEQFDGANKETFFFESASHPFSKHN